MTDDNNAEAAGSGADDLVEGAQQLGSEISATYSKLSGGERWAVLGAAIVLAGWLIFDFIVDEHSTGQLRFSLAVLIVGAAFVHHRRKGAADPVPYGSLLFVAAGILGLLGATGFIEATRDNLFDRDGTYIVGALILYVGAVMSGVGAVQLRGKQL